MKRKKNWYLRIKKKNYKLTKKNYIKMLLQICIVTLEDTLENAKAKRK